jgi:lysophospholipase L1-like esterase
VRNGRDDGQGKGAEGQWGWGNPIASYFDLNKINVVNRAVGGLSSRTYRTSGHWDRTKPFIKKGDVVVMQFGHNDASPVNDNSRARGVLRGTGPEKEEINNLLTGKPETVYTYGAYLRGYIAEIRAAGATPVIASPVIRKRWEADGVRVMRAGGNFAGWAAEVAKQENVAFIDLNEWGALRYEALGKATVEKFFPADMPQETVHTNWLGAAVNAQLVIAGLIQNKLLPDAVYTRRFAPDGSDDRPVVDARKVKVEAPRDPKLPSLVLIGDSTVRSGGQNGAAAAPSSPRAAGPRCWNSSSPATRCSSSSATTTAPASATRRARTAAPCPASAPKRWRTPGPTAARKWCRASAGIWRATSTTPRPRAPTPWCSRRSRTRTAGRPSSRATSRTTPPGANRSPAPTARSSST